MNSRQLLVAFALLVPFLGPEILLRNSAAEIPAGEADFFNKKIRPLLEENCFRCHSHAAGKSKGKLVVDSRGALLKGGGRGPALVPGHPEKSLLLKAVSYTDDDLSMPPKGKLAADKIALLRDWIKMGAPWPAAANKTSVRPRGIITDEDRKYWAFQPVRVPSLPALADPSWQINPIDRFIHHKLDREGLQPSPPAERPALLRRLYFDLVGLPPTPEEVDAFVKDSSPDAYEKRIDRLLASPRYGERWARHWLDLVRYAESDGYRLDAYRTHAWHYRDYVIRAFNADKPFDRFAGEQLAGDELAPDDPDALAATGYLCLWIYEYNQRDVRTQWDTILNDITDVTGEVFLGLGMGCARCHDHKYDPILQKDYYRLQAFFASILPRDDIPLATARKKTEHQKQWAVWQGKAGPVLAKIAAMKAKEKATAQKDAIAKFPRDIQAMLLKPEHQRTPLEKQLAALAYRQIQYEFDRIDKAIAKDPKGKGAGLVKELARFDFLKPLPLPLGMTVRDVGPLAPSLAIPGATRKNIDPGFPTLLDEKPANIVPTPGGKSTGRRTALARWLTRPDNPLTARVIVNRIWQYHFGRGLVSTSSNFGRLGELPTHPELLDWLAARFIQDRWSFKKMHRLILTSRTYRQSATAPVSPLAVKKDPENRWLWRMNTRRLDAEQIRDALLAVTGKLDLTMGGPGVDAKQPRRTIYVKVLRNSRHPLLDVFDVADGINSTGRRNVTTTPLQALLMINSPFMLDQARNLADRLWEKHAAEPEKAIQQAFRLAFGRPATPMEMETGLTFLHKQAVRVNASSPQSPEARRTALMDFCHVLLNANEFLYVD